MARSQWIQALTKGIRERSTDFRFENFGSQKVPHPPLQQQAAIVRFLDHADRRFRRYIRTKERLIGLLEEQKQAIIHEAVTGRIDIRTGQPYPVLQAHRRGVAGTGANALGIKASQVGDTTAARL